LFIVKFGSGLELLSIIIKRFIAKRTFEITIPEIT